MNGAWYDFCHIGALNFRESGFWGELIIRLFNWRLRERFRFNFKNLNARDEGQSQVTGHSSIDWTHSAPNSHLATTIQYSTPMKSELPWEVYSSPKIFCEVGFTLLQPIFVCGETWVNVLASAYCHNILYLTKGAFYYYKSYNNNNSNYEMFSDGLEK